MRIHLELMPRTAVLKKESNSVLLICDRKHILNECDGLGINGSGDYVVKRPNGKYYRVESLLTEYRTYKEKGYRYSHMY